MIKNNRTVETLNNLIYPRLTHEIIFSDLEPKDKGKWYIMTCPFCKKRNEFYAIKGSQWGQCNRKNHCGKGIGWWNYIKERFSLTSNKDILFKLAELASVQLPESKSDIKTTEVKKRIETGKMYDVFFSECKRILLNEHNNPDVKSVYDYLQNERGFSCDEIKQLDFGYFPDKKYVYSYLERRGFSDNLVERSAIGTIHFGEYYRLVIPYRDIYGRVEGFVCRLIKSPDDIIREHYTAITKRHKWITKGSAVDNIICSSTPIKGIKLHISAQTNKNSDEYRRLLKLENDIDIKKYKYSFGLKTPFFNMRAINNNKSVYIVEGIFDVLKLFSKGIVNVIGLGRDSLCSSHIEAINNSKINEIYFIPDCDDAGMTAVKKSIKQIIQFNIKSYVVTYSKYKDVDEYIRAEGIEPLKVDIANAERAATWLIKTMLQPPVGITFSDSFKEKNLEEIKAIIATVPDKSIRSVMCNIVRDDKDYKRPIARDIEKMVSLKDKENKVKRDMDIRNEIEIIRKTLINKILPYLRNGNLKEIQSLANNELNTISLRHDYMESDEGIRFKKYLTSIIEASKMSSYGKLKRLLAFHSDNMDNYDYEKVKTNILSESYKYFIKGDYESMMTYLNSQKKTLFTEGTNQYQGGSDTYKLINRLLIYLSSKDYTLLRLLLMPPTL